ncbi:SusC/RagA family TonB-linked outer membrane protein [Polaribacter sp.]|uniref:SusC/RagA family TonB-linked outer membrane protein n=1 Tax=Polaribacter sp. TaxID=1920175 RepID=UPI0025D71F97|nr:SusC/RagA family TonB-linked outer membrane protein [Polaribacter sp.]
MNIRNKNKILFFSFFVLLSFTNSLVAQKKGKIDISSIVVSESGNPIKDVAILGSKGVATKTDLNGSFSIKTNPEEVIVIKKEGYVTQTLNMGDVIKQITLVKSVFLESEKDIIDLGFKKTTKRAITGSISVINPKDRLVYDNTQFIRNYISGLAPGVRGNNGTNIRGLGGALFVIDGVFNRDPNTLNLEEVEQITILKDANAIALYGNQARDGVILINTKRGETNTKVSKVNVLRGLREPISFPKYLGAIKYMELFNEARANDGLAPTFSQTLIDDYKNSTNPYLHPDVSLYNSEYLRDFASTTSIISEFSGGNENTRFYVNLGWKNDQDLVKINPDVNKGANRFNLRANIDFKVNDFIKSSVDVVAIVNSNISARQNVLSFATTFKPNTFAPFLPLSLFDFENNDAFRDQVATANSYNGFLLGASAAVQNSPLANIFAGGYQTKTFRTTQFSNSIDIDLNRFVKGLTARTYLSFDFFDSYTTSIQNQFTVYEPVWNALGDKIIGINPFGGPDLQDQSENIATDAFVSRLGFYASLDYKRSSKNGHNKFNATFLAYFNNQETRGVRQPTNNGHLGLQLTFSHKNKYFFDFTGNYVSSALLPEGNRGGFSPTLGFGYILSEEDFLKDSKIINYLKFKTTGGFLKNDRSVGSYYRYLESYNSGTTVNWADGEASNRITNLQQAESPNLTFEYRRDTSIGFESYLFNEIWFEFNYFDILLKGQVTDVNINFPSYYSDFTPFDNNNAERYNGFESAFTFNKKLNEDFSLDFGGNIMYTRRTREKVQEIREFDYQKRQGTELGAVFGLIDDGFYTQSDFTADGDLIDGLPVPLTEVVLKPGDIKYIDQNNDGIIDNDDERVIGRTGTPWSYGINLKLNYKNFSLFVLGYGQFGGNAIRSGNYFWVEGDNKYSEVALNRWTPETAATATYPRLSSVNNPHNYRNSTFWLYDNSFFDIRRVQLTYEFDEKLYSKLGMTDLSINVTGTNVLQFAKNKELNQLNVGGNPQFRNYFLGLRASF